jgi:hypothetical protein
MFGLFYANVGSFISAGYTPLLDSFTTTPEFDWSVFQMTTTQTKCVRLRRDSDNAESDFGFTSSGLVDTAAIDTWLGGANAYVVTFYGSTRTATESVAADQGRFYTSGGNNNLPYVQQNTTVVLQNYPLSSSISSSTELHIITMSNHPAVGGFASIFSPSAGAVRYWYSYADNGTTNSTIRIRPSSSHSYSQAVGSMLGDCFVELFRDSSNLLRTTFNNSQTSSATITDSVSTLSLFTTGTNSDEMKISTMLFFNANLTPTERADLVSFYNNKFNKSI